MTADQYPKTFVKGDSSIQVSTKDDEVKARYDGYRDSGSTGTVNPFVQYEDDAS